MTARLRKRSGRHFQRSFGWTEDTDAEADQAATTGVGPWMSVVGDRTRKPAMKWALLHAVVWSIALWATSPDGDCTKSGDCKQGHYCKGGTCVPKEAR